MIHLLKHLEMLTSCTLKTEYEINLKYLEILNDEEDNLLRSSKTEINKTSEAKTKVLEKPKEDSEMRNLSKSLYTQTRNH